MLNEVISQLNNPFLFFIAFMDCVISPIFFFKFSFYKNCSTEYQDYYGSYLFNINLSLCCYFIRRFAYSVNKFDGWKKKIAQVTAQGPEIFKHKSKIARPENASF